MIETIKLESDINYTEYKIRTDSSEIQDNTKIDDCDESLKSREKNSAMWIILGLISTGAAVTKIIKKANRASIIASLGVMALSGLGIISNIRTNKYYNDEKTKIMQDKLNLINTVKSNQEILSETKNKLKIYQEELNSRKKE